MSVSVIIPVFNRPQKLAEAIKSVENQSFKNWEIIVVDDGSTDETLHVAHAIAGKCSGVVKVIHQENGGPAAARNRGLQAAQGEFIQYLDSDDLLLPDKFRLQVAMLENHPEAGLCYGVTLRRNVLTGEEKVWARTGQVIDNIFPSFLMQRGWDTNCPLWRRSTCEAVGPWGNFRVTEDWEHDLRAGILGIQPVQIQEPVVIVRDHGEDRASGMNTGFTPQIVQAMFRSHESIWSKMKEANLSDWSYLEEFSRKMFWIARLCGEHGLYAEATQCLNYAQEMVATHQSPWKLRAFGTATKVFGWKRVVNSTEQVRHVVQKLRGVK